MSNFQFCPSCLTIFTILTRIWPEFDQLTNFDPLTAYQMLRHGSAFSLSRIRVCSSFLPWLHDWRRMVATPAWCSRRGGDGWMCCCRCFVVQTQWCLRCCYASQVDPSPRLSVTWATCINNICSRVPRTRSSPNTHRYGELSRKIIYIMLQTYISIYTRNTVLNLTFQLFYTFIFTICPPIRLFVFYIV